MSKIFSGTKFKGDRSHEAQKWRISGFCVIHRAEKTREEIENVIE